MTVHRLQWKTSGRHQNWHFRLPAEPRSRTNCATCARPADPVRVCRGGCLSTWDAAADVKKTGALSGESTTPGVVYMLYRSGQPLISLAASVCHRRRQALIGQPDFHGPKLAWQGEDAAVRPGGAAIAGPPSVSVPSLLETSLLTAFQRLAEQRFFVNTSERLDNAKDREKNGPFSLPL